MAYFHFLSDVCEHSIGEVFIKVHNLVVTKDISLSRSLSVCKTQGDLCERSNNFGWRRRLEA